jgi:hypothetical protein
MLPCRLAQGTGDTSEGQILEFGPTALNDGVDMVYMKRGLLAFLGKATVFTSVARSPHHLSPQAAGNAHAALRCGR